MISSRTHLPFYISFVAEQLYRSSYKIPTHYSLWGGFKFIKRTLLLAYTTQLHSRIPGHFKRRVLLLTLFCKSGQMLRLIKPSHLTTLLALLKSTLLKKVSLRAFQQYKFNFFCRCGMVAQIIRKSPSFCKLLRELPLGSTGKISIWKKSITQKTCLYMPTNPKVSVKGAITHVTQPIYANGKYKQRGADGKNLSSN